MTVFRGFWFFGPNMPERNKNFIKSFFWPFQIVFGDGKNYRSITHLDDVIQAFISSSENFKTKGKCYWIASLSKALTVNQIYKEIGDALGVKDNLLHIPNIICDFLCLIDILYSKFFKKINTTLLAAGKFHKNIAVRQESLNKAKEDFEWSPKISLSQIKEEIKNDI